MLSSEEFLPLVFIEEVMQHLISSLKGRILFQHLQNTLFTSFTSTTSVLFRDIQSPKWVNTTAEFREGEAGSGD